MSEVRPKLFEQEAPTDERWYDPCGSLALWYRGRFYDLVVPKQSLRVYWSIPLVASHLAYYKPDCAFYPVELRRNRTRTRMMTIQGRQVPAKSVQLRWWCPDSLSCDWVYSTWWRADKLI
jgi:hypothetical protein